VRCYPMTAETQQPQQPQRHPSEPITRRAAAPADRLEQPPRARRATGARMGAMRRVQPRRPASDRAYDWTKEQILSGALGGGSMISEGGVSEAIGVSRTPVREAFIRLAAE